mmetsp:Transcript_120232/g.256596  ORF Transcript_120232/g.256596 Transcript_120232/m.256596 type:complete len:218 (+) Transcript_120232:111-764(+)
MYCLSSQSDGQSVALSGLRALPLAFGHAHGVGIGASHPPGLAILWNPVGRRYKLQPFPCPIVPGHIGPHLGVPSLVDFIHQGAVPVGIKPPPAHNVLHELPVLASRPIGPRVLQDRVWTVEPDLHDPRIRRGRITSCDVDRLFLPLNELRQVGLGVRALGNAADKKVELISLEVVWQVARVLALDDLKDCLLLQIHILPHRHCPRGATALPRREPLI